MKLDPTTQYWLGWIGMGLIYMTLDTLIKVAVFLAVSKYLGWTK